MKKKCSTDECPDKVMYECEDCGVYFCQTCAENSDYICECTQPEENIILIEKKVKQ